MKIKNLNSVISGFAVGAVNGFFGAGGGLVAVPLLKKIGINEKDAHVNAVAVILPITLLSAGMYLLKGYVTVGDALPFIPSGIAGAFIGTVILKKISPLILKKIFAFFMVYAGIRLLLR